MDFHLMDPSFWSSAETLVLLNPSLSEIDSRRLKLAAESLNLSGTLWIQSSGTESYQPGAFKLVAVSKAALLAAAKGVIEFYGLTEKDHWLNPLPLFHVGGLAVHARSVVCGCGVTDMGFPNPWKPESFAAMLTDVSASVTSLVPTQIVDLVDLGIRASEGLRLAFVGGGALQSSIYRAARSLGWPLIPTYGMTESCAMVAGATKASLQNNESLPPLELFPHMEGFLNTKGRWVLKGPGLATGCLQLHSEGASWQSYDGEFVSDDKVEINGRILKILGRDTEFVKILGESVDLKNVEFLLQNFFGGQSPLTSVVALPDRRRGARLYGLTTDKTLETTCDAFNQTVAPFLRLEAIVGLEAFPFSPIGKLQKGRLRHLLVEALQKRDPQDESDS